MRIPLRCLAALALLFLCGCLQVQDDITVQPDGSGTVKMVVNSQLPEELINTIGMYARSGATAALLYPPLSETEARRFFPGKGFSLKIEQTTTGDGKVLQIEASFKDVNTLLASPYGRSHQLTLTKLADGKLQLRTLSAAGALAQAGQMRDEVNSRTIPGLDEAQKAKNQMRFQFHVTLPNDVTEANGSREGKTVTWTFARAQSKDDDEFAAIVSGMLEATCSATAISFVPAPTPRLGLVPFGALTEGKVALAGALPDTNKVLAAARFVPYTLSVTRSLDLSGEGGAQASSTQLTGGILLPPELAPQRWGEMKLEEAVDAGGNNLMPKDENSTMSRLPDIAQPDSGSASEENPAETTPGDRTARPYLVSLNFNAPEWKVKQISRVKAVLELEYLGGSEVVKLSNAVPASMVMDMSKRSRSGFEFNSERGQMTDPHLSLLGLVLRVQMAVVQNGMTTVSLEASGRKAAIIDAQLFDKEGRSWTTAFAQDDSSDGSSSRCQLVVAGRPAPPFSLALQVGGVGASVALPIVAEDLPLGDQ
jgi:hypothetical protein